MRFTQAIDWQSISTLSNDYNLTTPSDLSPIEMYDTAHSGRGLNVPFCDEPISKSERSPKKRATRKSAKEESKQF